MALSNRAQTPILPHAELDPDVVAKAVHIAIALIGLERFAEACEYKPKTIEQALRRMDIQTMRIRTNLLLSARAVCQEQKQTFFDLAAIDPVQIPEAVFPYQIIRTIEMDARFRGNIPCPYDKEKQEIQWLVWQTFYMSCRPAHSPFIHLYGTPLKLARGRYAFWPIEKDRQWLLDLLNGPTGELNHNATIANPTLLDLFSTEVGLMWNVWGHSLRQGLEDVVAKRIA